MGYLQEVRLGDDPADAEVDDTDTLQLLEANVGTVVELKQIVVDDEHREAAADVLMLLGYMDQLAIDFETQVVDLALSPSIASSTPVALQLLLISLFHAVEIFVEWWSTNDS
mmetsp:Transcript_3021/g.8220  ORF Transcript_3021/g.8220 Transcript_3021/m.8220 type:complete len:112 (+) Transcript_3021:389-724(+)